MDETCIRFEHEWLHGNRDLARDIAREYVATHKQHLAATLDGYTIEGIVTLIEGYRAAGRHRDRIVADMWLLARYPPQQITGAIRIGDGAALAQAVADALRGGERR